MSSIPPVQDRDTIDEEITKKIRQIEDPMEKMQLIALNHYLELKKQEDQKLEEEMQKLANEFNEKATAIQDRVADIVDGKKINSEELSSDIDKYLKQDEKGDKSQFGQYIEGERLNGYWLKCLQNCPMIKNEIQEKDIQVLNDLKNIKYNINSNDKKVFTLTFIFNGENNEFFTNTELKKTFTLKNDDEPIKAVGEEIKFREGKDVTKKTVKKTQKNKKTGAKRQITKEVDDASFFNFFQTTSLDEDGGFEKMSEEKKGQLEQKINIDYDIARAIIDEVLPYSLEYYLNVRGQDALDYIHKQEEEEKEDEQEKNKKKQNLEKKDQVKDTEKPECKQQ